MQVDVLQFGGRSGVTITFGCLATSTVRELLSRWVSYSRSLTPGNGIHLLLDPPPIGGRSVGVLGELPESLLCAGSSVCPPRRRLGRGRARDRFGGVSHDSSG